jgi:hypothetical protein
VLLQETGEQLCKIGVVGLGSRVRFCRWSHSV